MDWQIPTNFGKSLNIWRSRSIFAHLKSLWILFICIEKLTIFCIKVHIFWEGHITLQNLYITFFLCSVQCQSNVRWRFRKILWPSQNIWTLLISVSFSLWSLILLGGTSDCTLFQIVPTFPSLSESLLKTVVPIFTRF